MVHEGRAYLRLNMAKRTYHVKSYLSTEDVTIDDYGDVIGNDEPPLGSLIDGGANGGLCGSDVEILEYTLQRCDVGIETLSQICLLSNALARLTPWMGKTLS